MKELSIFQHPDFGTVRNVVIKGEPWFMGKDICQVLGIANHKDALGRLDEDERCGVGITDPLGRQQEATFINESGLYSLIMQSRKPEAKSFKKWVTSRFCRRSASTATTSRRRPSSRARSATPSNAPTSRHSTSTSPRRTSTRFRKRCAARTATSGTC